MDRCCELFFRMSGKLSDTGKLTDLGIPTETEELGLSETPPNPSGKELLIKGFVLTIASSGNAKELMQWLIRQKTYECNRMFNFYLKHELTSVKLI